MRVFFLFFIFCVCVFPGIAQRTATDLDPRQQWDQAVHWFYDGKAALAYPIFLQMRNTMGSVIHPVVDQAESDYYRLACGVQLDEEVAVEEATRFILRSNPPSYMHSLSYYLADHHFRNQRYPDAQHDLEWIDARNLRKDEQVHRHFILGYTHFIAQRFDRALPFLTVCEHERSIPTVQQPITISGFSVYAIRIMEMHSPVYNWLRPIRNTEASFRITSDRSITSRGRNKRRFGM